MVIDLFIKTLKTPQNLPEPLVKANRMFVAALEKMMIFQINALKAYMNIGLNQMRAAAEVTDPQSFQDFCKRQTQIAQTVQYKMLHDMQALSDLNARFQTEVEGLNRATLKDVFLKAA